MASWLTPFFPCCVYKQAILDDPFEQIRPGTSNSWTFSEQTPTPKVLVELFFHQRGLLVLEYKNEEAEENELIVEAVGDSAAAAESAPPLLCRPFRDEWQEPINKIG